jgi:hypothetical protein
VRFGRTPDEAREWVLRSDEANSALVAATEQNADLIVDLRDLGVDKTARSSRSRFTT